MVSDAFSTVTQNNNIRSRLLETGLCTFVFSENRMVEKYMGLSIIQF